MGGVVGRVGRMIFRTIRKIKHHIICVLYFYASRRSCSFVYVLSLLLGISFCSRFN